MNIKKASKFLSLILRHRQEKIGLELGAGGWVSVDDLLKGIEQKRRLTMRQLEEVVDTNDKKRFSFNEDKTMIRASQGHSVKIDLELVEQEPPDILYHGTYKDAVNNIFKGGIRKMARHHVHLSADKATAITVGSRRGYPVVFEVDAKAMYEAECIFFMSDNGVWLTDYVPVMYLTYKKVG